ncbi:MAG: hypothetical protein JSV92_01465 [archaeon]|nr:MAG: hypothetical protein JSV92_01465 [archaeon]
MIRHVLVAALLISVLLACGCAEQKETATTTTTTTLPEETGEGVTGAITEDQAFDTIEQEMEQAAGNMSLEDIEGLIAG